MTDVIPMTRAKAQAMEEAFLSGLEDAQVAYEAIVDAEAWLELGYESFAAWWSQRVQPTMRALSMRPTREIAAAVVEKVREEEAYLPPAQRRTQRELAGMVGVHPDTISGRKRQDPDKTEPPLLADLERMPVAMPAGQQDADEILARLDERTADRLRQKMDIADSYRSLRDDLQAIPADRMAEIEESVRPAVQFGQLVSVCREFVERLAAVDLGYAARGLDPSKTTPIQEAVDRLSVLRQTLGATA